jgi:phosphoribosyl 1,2-cyclic phosphodiesterase
MPHYAEDGSACFVIRHKGESVAVITDDGTVGAEVLDATRGSTYIICESNHDEERAMSGVPFEGGRWRPLWVLRERSLGPRGHLSNEQAARFLAEAVTRDTRAVLLCHLSEDYNRPDLAVGTVRKSLTARGWQGPLAAAMPDRVVGPFPPLDMSVAL